MLKDALRYPRNRDNAITNPILVGGIVLIGSNFLVPLPLLYGYLVRVMNTTLKGNPRPPEFSDYSNLYVVGLKATLVVAVATVVPLIITVASIEALTGPYGGGGQALGIFFFVGLPLFALFWYFAPAFIGTIAQSGTLFTASTLNRSLDVSRTSGYMKGWVLGTTVYVATLVGLLILFLIPFFGAMIFLFGGTFISFYAMTASFYLYARGYAEGVGVEPPLPPVQKSTTFDRVASRGTEERVTRDREWD